MDTKKVTGLGGVFFKTKDPAALKSWYAEHLGLKAAPDGSVLFGWRPYDGSEGFGCTLWSPFKETTEYFGPSEHDYMINYRVQNLEALLEQMRAAGVTVVGDMQTYDFGKFGWVLDPDGRKVELWEPIGNSFGEMYQDHAIY